MTSSSLAAPLLAAVSLVVASSALAVPEPLAELADRAVRDQQALSVVVAYRQGDATELHAAGTRAVDSDRAPDVDTAYAIGSITKPFTHLLLAEQVDAGRVAYDTTLAELLDGQVEFANPEVGRITLEQLATHTSGLARMPANFQPADPQDPYVDFGSDALLQAVAATREGQPLGRSYAYSNFGAGLLGWLLGARAGTGYEQALTDTVLVPLGLEATGFVPGDNHAQAWSQGEVVPAWRFDALAGAGALWSTAGDLLRLADVLLGDRDPSLDHSTAADFEPVAAAGEFEVTRVWHVAATAQGPLYWHNGGTAGHRSFFAVRPATDEALVILVAGDLQPTGPALSMFGFDPPAVEPVEIDESVFGQYRLESVPGRVFERDGVLVAQLSGQAPVVMVPVTEDVYRLDVIDASLRVVREDDAVVALELIQNGAVQRAERLGDLAPEAERETVELAGEALDAYLGRYALTPQVKFTVRRGGESGLEVQLSGQPFFPVYPSGDDVFFYKVVEAELHFERDEDGDVVAVVLHQGGLEQRAARVDS
ncbi:serine hydrolase [Wenzhouxiangella sp. XN79A]|uniref:serine hydrolase n=1 Tax=Wenzhouxiangella sp. XN79A TaxID=2724193 RepID=UPI00144A8CC5|nr:serine hydrolase [Wenzhouxiangella sp. XN79A]NKI35568.1 serine hydrolase [Wenzhouxiangella sp. XN79A]